MRSVPVSGGAAAENQSDEADESKTEAQVTSRQAEACNDVIQHWVDPLVWESLSVGPDDSGTISGFNAPPIRDDPDSPP